MANLYEYQNQIDDFLESENYEPKYWTPHEIFMRLVEELGEVGRILNRVYGPKPPKPGEESDSLEEELGDILYALACLANREKINLDKSMQYAINKAMTRDLNRFPTKSD